MSMFNLSEAVKSGRLDVKVAEHHAATQDKPQALPVDDCPQCDGSGKEDGTRGLPIVCRRCAGVGTVTKVVKVAHASPQESPKVIQKVAQNFSDLPEIPDISDLPEDTASSPSEDAVSYEGTGDDGLRLPVNKGAIGSFVNSMDPHTKAATFEAVCEIMEVPTAEKLRRSTGQDGKPDEEAATDFIYEALDKMNHQQLKMLASKIEKMA